MCLTLPFIFTGAVVIDQFEKLLAEFLAFTATWINIIAEMVFLRLLFNGRIPTVAEQRFTNASQHWMFLLHRPFAPLHLTEQPIHYPTEAKHGTRCISHVIPRARLSLLFFTTEIEKHYERRGNLEGDLPEFIPRESISHLVQKTSKFQRGCFNRVIILSLLLGTQMASSDQFVFALEIVDR